jgi:hypothetical protein
LISQHSWPAVQHEAPQQSVAFGAEHTMPGLHGVCAHDPPEQNGLGPPHGTLHPPQLCGSLAKFTHLLPQHVSPPAQPASPHPPAPPSPTPAAG